ncbi:multiple epidermal growth factor-like domains protein 10 isoform X5 [Dreissena polymorpha]|uniref:multiple epidermal growth factor-like domains protein 10 isoform X5 n=1 Tax=Dreissena polymorpha TaxID=45954 RepID=UPI002263F3A0|nr:multiple epidermal growth factor-like domains protein 10 isoform X5 [Dreissena polymorpha]
MYTLQTITLFLFGFFLHSCKGAGIEYVGCYEDSSSNRILQGSFYFSDSNSPAECSKICSNYKFFGVQSGRHCRCGNALYSSTQKPESECSFICPGDRSKICGADWRINLYRHSDCPLGSNSVNCSKQCNCRVGSCDNVTGACGNEGCTDGWTGLACNERCALGSYSVNCSKQCHCRVGLCDSVTGACGNGGCKDGWKGIVCNESCPLGSYSVNCSKQCHCLVGPCDGVKGDCENDGCKDGWTGIACNDKCGGVLTESFGVITSPNFPSYYSHKLQCTWVINAPEGSRINVNLTDFKMETHSKCNYDYLELFNGPNASSPPIGKYCGEAPPKGFQSQSNSVGIVFITDQSQSAMGFRMTYTFTQDCPHERNSVNCSNQCHCRVGPCDGVTGACGNGVCKDGWKGTACNETCPHGSYSVNCSKYCHCRVGPCDGVTGACGNGGCKDGWTGIACNEKCGGVLTDPFGVITSPNYPSNYNRNVQCTWVINASEGYQINVNFTDFALEDSSECNYDFLGLFYGPNASSPLVGKFCGTAPPWRFQSQSNSVRIVFSTDSSDSARGFNLTYTFSVQDLFYMGCYEDSKNRILADYDYHSESNSPTECSNNCSHYKFFGVEARTHCLCGNTLHSTTKKPESECSFICSGDRSQICGAHWRINIYSHGDCPLGRTGVNCSKRCHCRVNPCDNVTGTCGNGGCKDGWKGMACNESCTLGSYSVNCSKQCHCRVGPCDGVTGACGNDGCTDGWTGIACNEKCGGVLTDPFGVITSPNYPSKYNRKVQCTWDINASEGYQINVNVTDFALEHHTECNYDYLELFNGPNASFPSFGKFCGTAPPRGFQSQSNSVRIVFSSDSSDSARGFNLTYTFSVHGCTFGRYSVNCSKQCHCRVGPCEGVTGACGNDGCKDGWAGIACNETNVSISTTERQHDHSEDDKSISEKLHNPVLAATLSSVLGVVLVAAVLFAVVYIRRRRRQSAGGASDNTDLSPEHNYEDLLTSRDTGNYDYLEMPSRCQKESTH